MYEVVYPLGKPTHRKGSVAKRLAALDGLTIAELSNHKFGSEITFEVVRRSLQQRFPNLTIIPHAEFGNTYGRAESEVVRTLPDRLRELKVDAVISGNGG